VTVPLVAWPSGLGKGLQSPVRGFDSRRHLQPTAAGADAGSSPLPADPACLVSTSVASFSGAMLGLMAVSLFLIAIGEIREGRLGAALVLGFVAVVLSGLAVDVAG
jgi:hypothetical protein